MMPNKEILLVSKFFFEKTGRKNDGIFLGVKTLKYNFEVLEIFENFADNTIWQSRSSLLKKTQTKTHFLDSNNVFCPASHLKKEEV